MKIENKKAKNFTCKHCRETSEAVRVVRKETSNYTYIIETGLWEDDKEKDTEEEELFCLNCGAKIDTEYGQKLFL